MHFLKTELEKLSQIYFRLLEISDVVKPIH